jgi:hypothetical protein
MVSVGLGYSALLAFGIVGISQYEWKTVKKLLYFLAAVPVLIMASNVIVGIFLPGKMLTFCNSVNRIFLLMTISIGFIIVLLAAGGWLKHFRE